MSDEKVAALVSDCQNGHMEAFGSLFDHFFDPVYRFVFYKTLHKETAEDITSDVFLKAVEKIHTYRAEKAAFSTWLFTIARNAVTDHFRTLKHEKDLEDIWDMAGDSDTLLQADTALVHEKLQQEMGTLTAPEREILILHFWQGYSYKEIATLQGKSEGSIKMASSRAVKRLREKFPLFAVCAVLFSL